MRAGITASASNHWHSASSPHAPGHHVKRTQQVFIPTPAPQTAVEVFCGQQKNKIQRGILRLASRATAARICGVQIIHVTFGNQSKENYVVIL